MKCLVFLLYLYDITLEQCILPCSEEQQHNSGLPKLVWWKLDCSFFQSKDTSPEREDIERSSSTAKIHLRHYCTIHSLCRYPWETLHPCSVSRRTAEALGAEGWCVHWYSELPADDRRKCHAYPWPDALIKATYVSKITILQMILCVLN